MKGITPMSIDIVGLIRGRKQQRAAGIEELAQRLARGEAVPPEEIELILDRTGCGEEMLQQRIDALVRRAELRQRVKAGEDAAKQLETIDSKIKAAWDKAVAAETEHRRLRAQHEEAIIMLGQAVRSGDGASDELLAPQNLSPIDRQRLADARQAATAAAEALADANRRLPELRDSLARAQASLADAAETAKQRRSSEDAQRQKAAAETAVKTRAARLKALEGEVPGLRQAAEQAEAAMSKLEAELRAS